MKNFDDKLLNVLKNNKVIKERGANFKVKYKDPWTLEIGMDWRDIGNLKISSASLFDLWALKHWFSSLWPRSKSLLSLFPCDERIEIFIASHLKRNNEHLDIIYNVWFKDEIIGHFFIWNFSGEKPELGVGILDKYQKNKLGYLFIIILINIFKSKGKKELYLTTALNNDAAFKLYKSVGFKYTKDVDHFLPGYDYKTIEREMRLDLNNFT